MLWVENTHNGVLNKGWVTGAYVCFVYAVVGVFTNNYLYPFTSFAVYSLLA